MIDNTLSGNKIIDNTINPIKILNYPSDGTKYLSGDGTWKVVSGGGGGTFTGCPTPVNPTDVSNKSYVDTSLTYNLTTVTYTGSLSGINANFLIFMSGTSEATSLKSSLNSIITSLGGTVSSTLGGTGIYLNVVFLSDYASTASITTISGYNDSRYDAYLYGSDILLASDTATILNNLYNSGKGIVLCIFALGINNPDTYKVTVSKMITSYNTTNSLSANLSINSSDMIATGITSLQTISCSQFTAINGATSITSTSGVNVLNYLDDFTGKGRRVDVNINSRTITTDVTTSSNNRFFLQALLWAGKKFNGTTTSTKLNLNAPELTSLKVYNTPTTDYDVVNKLFLTNNYIRKKGTITTTTMTSTGITITGGPIRLSFQMRETSTSGYGWPTRNLEITIFNNNAGNTLSTTNLRYYLVGNNTISGNGTYTETLSNGGTTASGIGSYLISGSYNAGSSIKLNITLGVISLALTNIDQVYDYYVVYQY